jgi:EAL domain-containing protein (putative c-di-GMP-specific phosphodiesterase class I)
VKIDYSFISEIQHSKKGSALVAAIIGMAHGLAINIIAEGVENTIQSDYLESLNCNIMQGFLFSKPVAVSGFLNTIATQHDNFPTLSSA